MKQASAEEIEEQRKKVFGELPHSLLVRACKVNDGILQLDADTLKKLQQRFKLHTPKFSFFIPASGSGSRMFQFIHEYQNSDQGEISGQMEHFINSLNQFAFFRQLPEEFKSQFNEHNFDVDQLCSFLLEPHGLGFSKKPKALIPFHQLGPFILNPFQEHLIQGSELTNESPEFHFTIQKEFESEFRSILKSTEELHGESFKIHFSFQSAETNSVAFDDQQNVVLTSQQQLLTRPSGHGALLPLLNELSSEIIFIKNIDNVQHYEQKEINASVLSAIGGLLEVFREEAREIFEAPSLSELFVLNEKYQIFDPAELDKVKGADAIRNLLHRPIRICGMVKNEGQPGGGPFWVNTNGKISKQIIEKSQISHESQQRSILLRSTHFNPVVIAACPYSFTNEKFDLASFCDPNAFFVVHKNEGGKSIQYLERPGLWNGGMADWITIFVEIPNGAFTPVKTALDLLNDSHQA